MTDLQSDARVEIATGIIEALDAAAKSARPHETGGLLIGWRDGGRVIIQGWLQLGTPKPRTNRFEIDARRATKALRKYLRKASNPLEGYVGAWHTHPALAPPSAIDLETFSASAASTNAPLAFIVLATDGVSSDAHVAWAGRAAGHLTVRSQRSIALERTGGG